MSSLHNILLHQQHYSRVLTTVLHHLLPNLFRLFILLTLPASPNHANLPPGPIPMSTLLHSETGAKWDTCSARSAVLLYVAVADMAPPDVVGVFSIMFYNGGNTLGTMHHAMRITATSRRRPVSSSAFVWRRPT